MVVKDSRPTDYDETVDATLEMTERRDGRYTGTVVGKSIVFLRTIGNIMAQSVWHPHTETEISRRTGRVITHSAAGSNTERETDEL